MAVETDTVEEDTMRKALMVYIAALVFVVAGGAGELSSEWSTRVGFTFGSSTPTYTTSLAFHTTLASWDVSSTSVLTGDGLSRQSFAVARDLGALALSGGFSLVPHSDGLTTGHSTPGDGLGWTAAGLELAAWDLSLKLDLGDVTLKITIVR